MEKMMKHTTVRKSNIELLRILAMLMILVVHVNGAAIGLPEPHTHWNTSDWGRTIVEAWSIIGVNLFVLISGWFGINTRANSIINYLSICGFYSLSIYAAVCIVKPADFNHANTLMSVLFLSHGDLWFIRDYFFLMLSAPLLNAGLRALQPKLLNHVFIAVLIISCWFGWFWGGAVNPTGYNFMQMVTIYIAGWWLRQNSPLRGRKFYVIFYILATAGIIVCARFMHFTKAYAYNSPLVIIAAMALFSIFASLELQNKWINKIASHTFAVYLIH